MLNQLLNNQSDPRMVELSEKYDWVIVPVFNVDGYEYTHTNVSSHLSFPNLILELSLAKNTSTIFEHTYVLEQIWIETSMSLTVPLVHP